MTFDWKGALAARETETHFVVEGRHAVERVKDSSYFVEKVIKVGIDLSRDEVSNLLGFHFHRSHLAVVRKPDNTELEDLRTNPGAIVVLPEIADPGNLGTIIRNTAGLGGSGLLLGKGASPWNAKAVRASAGTLFRLPVRRSDQILKDLGELSQNRVLVGTSLTSTSIPLSRLPSFMEPPVLLLGAEDFGLPAEIETLCHHLVHIPMTRSIDSLNVASASAIFLHQFESRERGQKRDPPSALPNT